MKNDKKCEFISFFSVSSSDNSISNLNILIVFLAFKPVIYLAQKMMEFELKIVND